MHCRFVGCMGLEICESWLEVSRCSVGTLDSQQGRVQKVLDQIGTRPTP